jgi:selenide, water dikinase
LKQAVTWQGVEEAAQVLLCDAQTSGGLLIAVAEAKADTLLEVLRAQGTPVQAVVGEIQGRGNGEIIVSA